MTEEAKPVSIPLKVRDRHIYIPGKTRMGKSTLLFWMALEDISKDRGVCVIDPHGDLVNLLLNHIPEKRVDDTIYLDAFSPIPIDFMSCNSPTELTRLVGDIMVMFSRFSESMAGDRWQSILQWTLHALLHAGDCSFLDIYYFLADPEGRRKEILNRVKIPEIRQFWNTFHLHYPKDAATPILTRMSKFILNPPLKIILGTPNAAFKIPNVLNDRSILLVNLGRTATEASPDDDTKNILGTLIVAKIQQAAMSRLPSESIPFYLYADEFQRFQTSAFDTILSEAAKFGLCLTLANQFLGQLEDKIRRSIFGNVGTYVIFNVHEDDARYFRGALPQAPEESAASKQRRSLEGQLAKLNLELELLKQRAPHYPEGFGKLISEKNWEIIRAKQQMDAIDAIPNAPKQGSIPTVDMIPRLEQGEAVYKPAEGTPTLIRTRKPPEAPKVSYAGTIKKRTVDKYPCPPSTISDTEKDDDIRPTSETVNINQEIDAKASRRGGASYDKGHSAGSKKAGTD